MKVKKVSLAEFKAMKGEHDIDALLSHFNGGSFMECHCKVFAATGIWIEELVPVFQRLDAHLATRNILPPEVR